MFKAKSLITAMLLAGLLAAGNAYATEAMVFKAPACGCCNDWNKHMELNGFKVTSEERDDIYAIKAKLGITDKLASCHTALIEGYVIEGHVPAADVQRLLKEKPEGVVGLTAPGMPMKSPGMQAEGLPPKGYDVLAIKEDGSTEVYSHY